MKRINKNAKVTLTLGQLKKLVKESKQNGDSEPMNDAKSRKEEIKKIKERIAELEKKSDEVYAQERRFEDRLMSHVGSGTSRSRANKIRDKFAKEQADIRNEIGDLRTKLKDLKKSVKESMEKKFSELTQEERLELLDSYWVTLGKFGGYSNDSYKKWLNQRGYDTSDLSDAEFNKIMSDDEDAFDDEEEDEEDTPVEIAIDVEDIDTKEEAAEWLDSMTEKYGNTYFFPDDVWADLNKLIEKFGSTYHWYK